MVDQGLYHPIHDRLGPDWTEGPERRATSPGWTDRIDADTDPTAPKQPRQPGWRLRLRIAAGVSLAGIGALHAIQLGLAVPAGLLSVSYAGAAVIWVACLGDVVIDGVVIRATLAVRRDLATRDQQRSRQVAELTKKVQALAVMLANREDQLAERLDEATLRGTQRALDQLGPHQNVVSMRTTPAPQQRPPG